ncbi:MAG TPA: glycoside hydrolase family 2 TIM barrel-domain containing protein [Opitutaceae bacterium]|nr:glycoside hydrolase family 2 TIM barrel-domain containing protein [Opitutaceae bacterium]
MLRSHPLILSLAVLLTAGCTLPDSGTSTTAPITRATVAPTVRVSESFDAGWRFLKGDVPGAEQPGFDAGTWRSVTLPHDWSIEGTFSPENPAGGAGAFLPTGVAWYRKQFTLPAASEGKRVFVEFEGVMQNSDVWINGQHLGHRPYGYVSFQYELTPYLRHGPGATNVLAVRTDTSKQPASRWYAGSGIYRHVRLTITDPVHVAHWSTFVSASGVSAASAVVHVATEVRNESAEPRNAGVHLELTAPDGRTVATGDLPAETIAPGARATFSHDFTLPSPVLWNLDAPRLYRAAVSVRAGAKVLDDETVTFGIRDAHFESATGFWLNGRNVKLLGVCLHEDGGAFGAAVPLGVWRQWLTTLRTLGVNAIRTAHNPPAPEFLDLCDRLGFLVMDEMFDCWTVGKNPYDYHLHFDQWAKTDLRDTVRRDRNHPSIVLYSAGNEIHDTPQEEKAKAILAGLVADFHENDPTRPVTQALFRPNSSHDYTNGLAAMLDVVGTNYRDPELLAAWRAHPGWKIVGTEQRHDRKTWLELRDHPAEAGQFLWTGVDYLGESRRWPIVAAGSGLLDRTGQIKPMAYERQSWWSSHPMVAITRRVAPTVVSHYDPGYEPANAIAMSRWRQVLFRNWTPRDRAPHAETVEVYSNCDSVELFLNGQSLGSKPLNPDASPRVWHVSFAPGTLRAVARDGGQEVAQDELRTAGAPAAIVLHADAPSVGSTWDEVDRVTATVVDRDGVPVPSAADAVTFTVDGPGVVAAVDNADNASHELFQTNQRRAYQGRCVAYVRGHGAGPFTLTASAPGLMPGTVTLRAQAR